MNCLKNSVFIFLLLLSANVFAGKIITVSSPDSKIRYWVSTDKNGLFYKVAYKGVLMADKSRLNISFKEGGAFNRRLVLSSAKSERLVDDYTLLSGKTSKVHSECNRVIIPVRETGGV